MIEIEKRIFVSDEVLRDEHSLMYGKDKDRLVKFMYYNIKRDKEGKEILKTYSDALKLARERSRDGRYKNYEFLICL